VPRPGWWALLPLLTWGAAGCALPDPAARSAWLQRMRAAPVAGAHAVVEVALIERPAGDPYINRGLWNHTDELVIDLERRAHLEENGVRVGQLVGGPPNDFQQLLLSPRSCNNPHALMIPLGRTVPVYLGPVLSRTEYEVTREKARTDVAFDQARFALELAPALMPDGRTRITFTPKVENGETSLPFEAAPDESSWTLRLEKPCKRYPELSWDVTLGPNQYLVIGGRLDQPRSLGYRAFVQEDGPTDVQRLLVLRIGTPMTPTGSPDGAAEEFARTSRSLPLALQAAMPSYRAKGP
jgi:hypothetical protein